MKSEPACDPRNLFCDAEVTPNGCYAVWLSGAREKIARVRVEPTGNGDIYMLDLTTGDTRRLTYDDSRELLDGWSSDGKWIYFSSNSGGRRLRSC